jgi:hypothetical protein
MDQTLFANADYATFKSLDKKLSDAASRKKSEEAFAAGTEPFLPVLCQSPRSHTLFACFA